MKSTLALAACVFAASVPCFADTSPAPTTTWEIYGGANASGGLEIHGGTFGDSSTTNLAIDLGATAGYFLTKSWEALAGLNTQVITASEGNTIFTPRVGVAYNFGDDTARAFFVGGLVGPSIHAIASSGNTYLLLSYWVHAGKRFYLADHVSWAPEVFVSGHTSGSINGYQLGSYMEIGAEPLLISILF